MKTGGEWVSSLDIEDLILRVPGVAEVAVVGVPDDRWGERPVALVVVKPGQDVARTEEAIRQHVGEYAKRGDRVEVRRSRSCAFRRRDPEDERRQARQEGDSRQPCRFERHRKHLSLNVERPHRRKR